jgi:hypothetical protein
MRRAGQVTCMEQMDKLYNNLVNLKGREHLGDLGVDDMIILK